MNCIFFRYTDIDAIGSYRKQLGTTMEERVDEICGDHWFRTQGGKSNKVIFENESFTKLLRGYMDKGLIHDFKDLFEAIINSVVQSTAYYKGQPIDELRVVVKGVQQSEFMPELVSWFPDIKFIYVLRNPYGQINSAIHNMRHAKKGKEEQQRIKNDSKKLHKDLPYPFSRAEVH